MKLSIRGDNKCVSLLEDHSYYLQVDFMSLSPYTMESGVASLYELCIKVVTLPSVDL